MQTIIPEGVRPTFRALARVVVPESSSMAPEEWNTLEDIVARALAARPPAVQKQAALFLRLIEFLPVLRYAKRFSRLSAHKATALLRSLERSPVLAIRRGVWGLRTLIMMGVYTQPAVQSALGYRAHPDGWSLLRRSGEYQAVPDSPRPT